MNTLVITEKPSQARNVQAAIGSRYGQILPAQGHLLRLASPQEANPNWKAWGTDVLMPEAGRYGFVSDRTQGKGDRIDKIKNALKSADKVIIATDCDREGQAIGENLLHFFNFKGTVLRAMFTAEDEKTLQEAFANAKPNSHYSSLYGAAVARSQSDQIFNLSLTRTATVKLVPRGAKTVIGIGRVKTPTMAIVCKREAELANFKPKDYFELIANVASADQPFQLFHKPSGNKRIFEQDTAALIQRAVTGWTGQVIVKTERKTQAPPKPVDLPTLQKRAAAWGWTAKKTLQTAQALYETHKITTYPRAATRYLPENMIDGAKQAFDALIDNQIFGKHDWPQATIRTGKKGVFSNAAMQGESHHAIIPNPAVADRFMELLPKLSEDERTLFDFIAKAFLSALGPEHVFNRTEIAINPAVEGQECIFKAVGKQTLKNGWKALSTPETANKTTKDTEEEQELPKIADGTPVSVTKVNIQTKQTTPPPRYSEGSLIEAMQNAWKFVDDETEQAQLKETKGIGTPATRDTIIEGLKNQNLITLTKGKLFASNAAMDLYRLLQKSCPDLIDPGSTARIESRLDDIVKGTANTDQVIEEISTKTEQHIKTLTASDTQLNIKRPPSPAMLKYAKDKAKRENIKLSKEQLADYDKISAFLGPRPDPGEGPRQASPAQIKFAEQIAARTNSKIPQTARQSAKALSEWIDKNNRATPKQMEWVTKLLDQGKIKKPKGYPDKVSGNDAKAILDKAFRKK